MNSDREIGESLKQAVIINNAELLSHIIDTGWVKPDMVKPLFFLGIKGVDPQIVELLVPYLSVNDYKYEVDVAHLIGEHRKLLKCKHLVGTKVIEVSADKVSES
jgi:hypothetical protein